MSPLTLRISFALLFAALAAGCSAPVPAKEFGAVVFNDPAFAGTRLNAYACSTCHAEREGDTRFLPGYSMAGATKRTVTGKSSSGVDVLVTLPESVPVPV